MCLHLRANRPQSQLPGAERSGREGEGMGQVGGFVNGQAHATFRVIFRVVEHEVTEGAVPMGGTLFSSRMGLWPYA
jgi:hypothetical protein